MTLDPIIPTRHDIEAWRLSAEAARLAGGVKPGAFDWPWVVLSLIQALETRVILRDEQELRQR